VVVTGKIMVPSLCPWKTNCRCLQMEEVVDPETFWILRRRKWKFLLSGGNKNTFLCP